MARRAAFRQSDLTKVMKAATRAGCELLIAPSGEIRVRAMEVDAELEPAQRQGPSAEDLAIEIRNWARET